MTTKKKKIGVKKDLTRKEKAAYVERAKAQYNDEGSIEVDDGAKVSWAPEGRGAYVQGWLWVDEEEQEIPYG